jgi:mono/diheme cytochrome c family protein
VSANLTPGGPLKDYTDGEILRVLREGVDKNGRKLVVMSGIFVRNMSDEDLKALIAYLRSEDPVENDVPKQLDQVNLVGAAMAGLGLVPSQPAVMGSIVAPDKAVTAEYGQYVISYQDCRVCHGPDLNGGKNQLTPNGPSLLAVKGWTQADFIQTLRTGVAPDGHQLNSIMPWKAAGRLDDTDLGALYLYITSLE